MTVRISTSANPNYLSRALHDAAFAGDTLRLRDLLLNPLTPRNDLHGPGSSTTALMEAARIGHISAVELLLEHGADPRVVMDTGATAADLAHVFPTLRHRQCCDALSVAVVMWDRRDLETIVQPISAGARRRM